MSNDIEIDLKHVALNEGNDGKIHTPVLKSPRSEVKEDECLPTSCVPNEKVISFLDRSYASWNSFGLSALSALCLGTCVLSVLTLNGILSLLSCNSIFSILSVNSVFSILSTNSVFSIGCVDKKFAYCW